MYGKHVIHAWCFNVYYTYNSYTSNACEKHQIDMFHMRNTGIYHRHVLHMFRNICVVHIYILHMCIIYVEHYTCICHTYNTPLFLHIPVKHHICITSVAQLTMEIERN